MTRAEKKSIIDHANTLTDEELEKITYDAIYDSLGSQCDDMYELGYDMSDIIERQNYEKYLSQKSDLLIGLCEGRGIELFKEREND